YLKEIREFIESDEIEEMQRECEVTNVFPQCFFDLCNEHQLFRISLPEEYGGWGLSEHQILQVQEEFSRGPGGMRMFIHFCQDLNWRPLYDFGSDELKAELMPKFGDETILSAWCVTEQTGGTGADLHTTAVQDPETGDWIINGEKWLISFTDGS
ncbi:MAG: acyl-CoA dehydrogenase family protein, partial [Coriobacteriaceae bacterium]|nr:acyl-CoA dehydrogenase family protein [Coriobacteriaceae bacterium]